MLGEPAFDVPPDIQGVASLSVWFTDPPGAVVQMAQPDRGTVEMGQWLVGPMFDRMRQRFPSATSIILVMDMSLMTGRDPAVRAIMMDKGRECRELFARAFVVPPVKPNPLYLTGLHAAAALLTAFGVNLVVAGSLEEVFAQCPLRPARREPS